MHRAENTKRFLAIVIVACFFLPLAQCSPKEPVEADSGVEKRMPQVLVPAHDVKLESIDEIPLVAMYVWPLAFIAVRARTKSRRSVALVAVLEGAIGGFVLWAVVQTIQLWGTVRYGGIILVSAHLAYLAAVAVTLYGCVREPSNNSLQARRP